jgi:hypothetical protein
MKWPKRPSQQGCWWCLLAALPLWSWGRRLNVYLVLRKRSSLTSFHPTPPGSSSLLQVSINSEEVQTSKVHRAFVLRAAPVRVSQPPVSRISPFPISTICRITPANATSCFPLSNACGRSVTAHQRGNCGAFSRRNICKYIGCDALEVMTRNWIDSNKGVGCALAALDPR